LSGIRCYLETVALERQRVLCAFSVDGKPSHPGGANGTVEHFGLVEGHTIDLDQIPLHLIIGAREQAAHAKSRVHSVVTLILVNDGHAARELWWDLAVELKRPLVTLCLLPDTTFGDWQGNAFWTQLHKWQFEHLAVILKDVDEACWSEDSRVLSHVLEHRVLPWLNGLQASLDLSYETLLAGLRADL
jgi:hypothetical protein